MSNAMDRVTGSPLNSNDDRGQNVFDDQPFVCASFACLKCQSPINGILCPQCHPMISIATVNYFDLFCCQRSLSIDQNNLELRYYNLQKLLHPDQHHKGSTAQQFEATKLSSLVNLAYDTLSTPLRRALYFFQVKDCDQTIQDPELLGYIMDLQDQLQDIIYNPMNKQACEQFQDNLTQAFDQTWDVLCSLESDKDSPIVTSLLGKLQYLNKMIDQVKHQQVRC